ncbi:MAG: single-stranded-DNA-specific exonuclease RecJ [Deltaproteobacteria bacterium]|nr:single-stranded-DNA-specific exonuclease RecJ [Deltaproteobacteria bacterium]
MDRIRRWNVAAPHPAASDLAAALGVHPVVAQVLLNRGVTDAAAARRFLTPHLADLRDPANMADMDRAVARLLRAVADGETIGIFGDYDVDGVTSTVLLSWTLETLGAHVTRHIPQRLTDGYGLNERGLRALGEQGARLVVAVDCGSTAHGEIAAARDRGIDVIVVDHHTLVETLPPASAVLNPHRRDCRFGFADLAAVGVTFFLCVALRRAWREAGRDAGCEIDLRRGLDLVALGTVADQVSLVDQNRILVSAGLKEMARTRWVGLRALCEVAGVDPARAQSGRIAFQLGPRINAAGRLGDAMVAVELLCTDDRDRALALARELDEANRQRRQIERQVLDEAAAELMRERAIPAAIVLANPGWHPGVVGIVAAKLCERYHRPTLLIGSGGRGSGRSVAGFNLVEALAAVRDRLLGYGGHAQAVGVRVEPAAVAAVRAALGARAIELLPDPPSVPALDLDATLDGDQLDLGLAEALGALAPYGRGNPEAAFALERVDFRSLARVGNGHVRFVAEIDGRGVGGIGFGMADKLAAGAFARGARLAIVPEVDEWGAKKKLSLRAIDIISPRDHARSHEECAEGGSAR